MHSIPEFDLIRSPKCWLQTNRVCMIATWRSGLRASLVARNYIHFTRLQFHPFENKRNNIKTTQRTVRGRNCSSGFDEVGGVSAGGNNPERSTSKQSCRGVFTNQFIFRMILARIQKESYKPVGKTYRPKNNIFDLLMTFSILFLRMRSQKERTSKKFPAERALNYI